MTKDEAILKIKDQLKKLMLFLDVKIVLDDLADQVGEEVGISLRDVKDSLLQFVDFMRRHDANPSFLVDVRPCGSRAWRTCPARNDQTPGACPSIHNPVPSIPFVYDSFQFLYCCGAV